MGIELGCKQQPENYSIASKRAVPFNSSNEIFYHLGNFSIDLPKHEQILIFNDVFGHFNHQLWPLRCLSSKHDKDAYFKIYFVGSYGLVRNRKGEYIMTSPFNFQDNPNTLAVAYPRRGGKYDGHVFVNDNKLWECQFLKKGGYDLQKVLIHEIAHAFGLGHTNVKGDIMQPQYNANNQWTDDSVKGLNEIYGDMRWRSGNKLLIFNDAPKRKWWQLF